MYAISQDWQVFLLNPCSTNEQCFDMSLPDSLDSKWPSLAQELKKFAGTSSLSFTVNNGAFINSKKFSPNALILESSSISTENIFAFDFINNKVISVSKSKDFINGTWISSDVQDGSRLIVENGNKITFIVLEQIKDNWNLQVNTPESFQSICNISINQIQFNKQCSSPMSWDVIKGVRFKDRFYIFGHNQVFVFLAKEVENSPTKVNLVDYSKFIHCPPQSIAPSNSITWKQHRKISATTVGIILFVILFMILCSVFIAYRFLCSENAEKAPNDKQRSRQSDRSDKHKDSKNQKKVKKNSKKTKNSRKKSSSIATKSKSKSIKPKQINNSNENNKPMLMLKIGGGLLPVGNVNNTQSVLNNQKSVGQSKSSRKKRKRTHTSSSRPSKSLTKSKLRQSTRSQSQRRMSVPKKRRTETAKKKS